MRNTEKFKTC